MDTVDWMGWLREHLPPSLTQLERNGIQICQDMPLTPALERQRQGSSVRPITWATMKYQLIWWGQGGERAGKNGQISQF